MKNTPTTLKWLAEQRARLLHDLAAAEQVAADVNKAVEKLREQLGGIDVCLKIYDPEINPALIAPVNGWKGTYGKRGNLRETILGILKLHAPESVTTNLIESLVAFEHKLLELLELADSIKIWGYANLAVGDVPYVLLVLADFSPKTGRHKGNIPERKFWLRYFYDASLRHIEDLWIHPSTPPQLFRVSYDLPPRARTPGYKNIIKSTPLTRTTAFLSHATSVRASPKWLTDAVEAWFDANWPGI